MRKTLNLALSYPKLVIFIFLLFALLSIIFAKKSLEIDTSTESLINQKLDFKINQKKMKDEFKVLSNNILISIKGKDKKEIDIYTQKLLKIFKTRDDLNFLFTKYR